MSFDDEGVLLTSRIREQREMRYINSYILRLRALCSRMLRTAV